MASFTKAVQDAIDDKAKGGDADAVRWGPHPPARFPDIWPPVPAEEAKDGPPR